MSDAQPPVEYTADTRPSAGAILREARLAARLGPEDIAVHLKLVPRQVIAIEESDWEALPEWPFTRGFILNYARLLNIDPATLGLDQSRPRRLHELKATPVGMGEISEHGESKSSSSRWMIPGLLVVIIALGIAYYQYTLSGRTEAERTAPAPATPPATTATTLTPPPASPTPEAAPQAPSGAVLTPGGGSPGQLTVPAPNTTAPATAPTTPEATPAQTPPAATTQTQTSDSAATPRAEPAADGSRRIQFTVKDRSWIEVRSDGRVVLSEILNPGTRELSAKPPLAFVVGNARQVEVQLDGQPYDIGRVTRNDVARFRIE